MNLTIFSCSPKPKEESTTASIVKAFVEGVEEDGRSKAEVYYLNNRQVWNEYISIYEKSNYIVFAMPIYMDCIPGIMKEFIEYLGESQKEPRKQLIRRHMGFIIQGGFLEAHQLRCTEHYLEGLPAYFNAEYLGTLLKGGMYGLDNRYQDIKDKKLNDFRMMGTEFVKKGCFDKKVIDSFAAPEYFSKLTLVLIKCILPITHAVWRRYAEKRKVQGTLEDKPYEI